MKAMRQRWEYHNATFDWDDDVEDYGDWLNSFGEDGWQLVVANRSVEMRKTDCIFMRPAAEELEPPLRPQKGGPI